MSLKIRFPQEFRRNLTAARAVSSSVLSYVPGFDPFGAAALIEGCLIAGGTVEVRS